MHVETKASSRNGDIICHHLTLSCLAILHKAEWNIIAINVWKQEDRYLLNIIFLFSFPAFVFASSRSWDGTKRRHLRENNTENYKNLYTSSEDLLKQIYYVRHCCSPSVVSLVFSLCFPVLCRRVNFFVILFYVFSCYGITALCWVRKSSPCLPSALLKYLPDKLCVCLTGTSLMELRNPRRMLKEFKASSFALNCSANVSFVPLGMDRKSGRAGENDCKKMARWREFWEGKWFDVCPPKLNFFVAFQRLSVVLAKSLQCV